MKKVVVLTSGGMDSITLLHYMLHEGYEVRAIAFNYGQRHKRELDYAHLNADRLGVPLTVVNLASLATVLPGSSQTDSRVPVPQGRYDEETMKATIVPNRNMILLAVAIGHAIGHGFDSVAYAAHAGDHAIYPDCRPEFAQIMEQAAALCDWRKISLLRPFIAKTKADIVRTGSLMGVDYSKTWSCYEGLRLHCGMCGTCIERREAFYLAGVPDPTAYDPTAPGVSQMVANGWHLPSR